DRIRSGLLAHHQRDGGLSIEEGRARRILDTVHDARHVAHAEERAARARDQDVRDFLGCLELPAGRHGELAAAPLEAAAGQIHVLRADGVRDVIHREPGAREPRGIDDDLDLSLPPADELDLADTGDALDALLHDFVRELGELARPELAAQRDRHDGRRPDVELLDRRRIDPIRQVGLYLGYFVPYFLHRLVDRDLELELDDDLGDALEVDRPEHLDARERVDRLLDGIADFALHRG